jgi:hypothetical protein
MNVSLRPPYVALPLLVSDRDWDLLGDRLRQLLHDLEDQDLARVLLALDGALRAGIDHRRCSRR